MRHTSTIPILALALWATASDAEDKKNPRSLPEDGVFLTEKSGKLGWESGEVTASMDEGKKTATGTLRMRFRADKDKPTGRVLLVLATGPGKEEARFVKYELAEADGKRLMRLIDDKETRALEYAIDGDKFTIKGEVIRKTWATWDVDPAKGIAFKPGTK